MRLRYIGSLVIAALLVLLSGSYASAALNWSNAVDVKVGDSLLSRERREVWHYQNCQPANAQVDFGWAIEDQAICTISTPHGSLAAYSALDRGYAFQKPDDTMYHRVPQLTGFQNLPMLLQSGDLVAQDTDLSVNIVPNLAGNLTEKLWSPDGNETTYKAYDLDFDSSAPIVDGDGKKVYARQLMVSLNERFAALELSGGGGVAVVDLTTRQAKLVTTEYVNSRQSSLVGVSNDGKYIMVLNASGNSGIVAVDNNCGLKVFERTGSYITRPCYTIDTSAYTKNIAHYRVGFLPDNTAYVDYWSESKGARYRITFTPDSSISRLDYLALGDSYSSGEGDIRRTQRGQRVYEPGTDVQGDPKKQIPEEKCHISRGSYPYLLRANMGLMDTPISIPMRSVACSGAKIDDIYRIDSQDEGDYVGQIDSNRHPRLHQLSESSLDSYQEDAIHRFLPGRLRQIDFAKKYKPKTLTLTIGGNDVDFGSSVRKCFLNTAPCNSADAKADLAKKIQQVYPELKSLYVELKKASPTTKIFVLGYPQFVTDASGSCKYVYNLGSDERRMMVQAVTYLNNTIKAAASSEGVTYIDIEDSFYRNANYYSDHRLCGRGESYVTSPDLLGTLAEMQELFHPNAKGHFAIYNKINDALGGHKLSEGAVCNETIVCPSGDTGAPAIPEYFVPPEGWVERTIKAVNLLGNEFQKQSNGVSAVFEKIKEKTSKIRITVPPWMLAPLSTGRIVATSDPVDLGEFRAAPDGSLDVEVSLKDVPAGFHTLHVYGVDGDGEEVDYYQEIEIRDATANNAGSYQKIDDKATEERSIQESTEMAVERAGKSQQYANSSTYVMGVDMSIGSRYTDRQSDSVEVRKHKHPIDSSQKSDKILMGVISLLIGAALVVIILYYYRRGIQ